MSGQRQRDHLLEHQIEKSLNVGQRGSLPHWA